MEIRQENVGDSAIISPVSRVDSASAKALEGVVLAAVNSGAAQVVVDFSQLDYISSAGLRVVLVGAKMMRTPRKFVLCAMKPAIREIFDVSGFSKILTILPDRDAALAAG